MAEPAHSAAGPGPDGDPERKPDPRAKGWGDVRCVVTLDSQAIRLAVEDVRRAAEDVRRAAGELASGAAGSCALDAAVKNLDAAVQMNEVTVGVMQYALAIAGRCSAEEAVIELERKRGFDEGVEWCKAQRCRLEVVDGGREG